MTDKTSRFGLGIVVGAAIGAIAGLLLSPKTGKENRELLVKKMKELQDMYESGELNEHVQTIFGDIREESVKIYEQVRAELKNKYNEIKDMSPEEYSEMIEDIIDRVKQGTAVSADRLKKLRDTLVIDTKEAAKDIKKEAKKTKEDIDNTKDQKMN